MASTKHGEFCEVSDAPPRPLGSGSANRMEKGHTMLTTGTTLGTSIRRGTAALAIVGAFTGVGLASSSFGAAAPAKAATVNRTPSKDTNAPDGTKNVHGRNDGPKGPTTGTRDQKIQRVIAAAKSQVGHKLCYSWGGGGKGGASFGIKEASPAGISDYNHYGFDCSGFTLYAYWKGAGMDIGAVSSEQYAKYKKIPAKDLKPGDLVFHGVNGSSHVAIYLGDGKVLEAAPRRDANSIHIKNFVAKDWQPNGVRPIP